MDNKISEQVQVRKPVLTVCILAKTDICCPTIACFMNLINNKELTSLVTLQPMLSTGQSDLPKARSEQVTGWYLTAKSGDLFLFIDSDQTFSGKDVLTSLYHMENNDIVCGAYSRRDGTMTVQPKNIVDFYKERSGELWYGATGFMMFSFDIVDKIAKALEKQVSISNTKKAYQFFFERVVTEPETNRVDLWLSEDYSFCWLARQQQGRVYGYISPSIGHLITQEQFVQIPQSATWPEKSIVYYCGKTSEAWSPKNLDLGIGGSELAVLKLTPFWQKQGYSVTVFCNCDTPGVYNGVVFKHSDEFRFTDTFDILIIWRSTDVLNYIDVHARKCFLDLHDIVISANITQKVLENVTKLCVKSAYHRKLLGEHVRDEKIAVISNGGAYEIVKELPLRDPNYLIYASSYDRGIPYMLKFGWPKIKKACPDAYLRIYYGWNGFDAVQPKTKDTQLYKKVISDLMEQDGVKECGRIPQKELLMEKAKANIHWYTGDFQEIDCISVRESASVGCIPVVSEAVEVFREKSYCPILIEGEPKLRETQEKASEKIIELLQNQEYTEKLRNSLDVPSEETWERVSEKWLQLFE